MRTRQIWTLACWMYAVTIAIADAEETKQPATESAPVRTLTVDPRAVERPLMKYRLLPAEYELRDGNAAPVLLRLPWDQVQYFLNVVPTFGDYLDLAFDDPKLVGAEHVFSQAKFEQLKRAAYLRTADWEYPFGEVPLANILLPDVQGARDIVGRGLSVWIRHRIAIGKLSDAREGILVGLAVSRHYGRTPFMITQLVCAAIDSMMLDRLEELISQPGCPNLYWALAALPHPVIDLQPSAEVEQQMLVGTVPGLDHLELLKTEAEWNEKATAIFNLFANEDRSSPPVDGNLRLTRVAGWARARQSEWSEFSEVRLEKMSDAEVAVQWLLYLYQDYTQAISAAMRLEPKLAIPRVAQLNQDLSDLETALGIPTLFVMKSPLSMYLNIHRIERRIKWLQTIEALRHYAATHDSSFPKSLDEIVETPVPSDPFTGQPFHYEANEGAATLRVDGVEVDERVIGAMHYRIELRGAAESTRVGPAD